MATIVTTWRQFISLTTTRRYTVPLLIFREFLADLGILSDCTQFALTTVQRTPYTVKKKSLKFSKLFSNFLLFSSFFHVKNDCSTYFGICSEQI
jgi:hypothetical protein